MSAAARPVGDDDGIEEPTAEELAAQEEEERKDTEAVNVDAPGLVFLQQLYSSHFPNVKDPMQFSTPQKFCDGGYVSWRSL